MSPIRRRFALALMDLCTAVLPAHKGEWLRAMRAEAAHIEDRHLVGFAAGCLLACCKERVTFMSNIPPAARYAMIAAMLVYAAFTTRSAMRMTGEPGLTAPIFGGVAASYALAAVWSMLRGGRGLIEAVLTLLTFNLAAALWLFGANATEGTFNTQLISAVAFEGMVIWTAALGIIFLIARIPRLPTTPANSPTR
jgi:hypothetical protein